MRMKLTWVFCYAVAISLFTLALAQLTTLNSTDLVLNEVDPLLGLSGRSVLVLLGAVELLVASIIVLLNNGMWRLGKIALLAIALTGHRLYLRTQNAPDFTDCLGNFNRWLSISPRAMSIVISIFLGFMLAGSCSFLLLTLISKKPVPSDINATGRLNLSPLPQPTPSVLRLAFCWTFGAVSFAALVAASHLELLSALPADFNAKTDDIASMGTFRDTAMGSRAGTKLLYAREIETGVGFFVKDLQNMSPHLIGAMDDPLSVPENAFRLIGWAPDDKRFAIAVDCLDNQTIAICSGKDQKLERAFPLRDNKKRSEMRAMLEIKRGIWLSADMLILMDSLSSIYIADLKNNRIRELVGYTTPGINRKGRIGDFTLTATSAHSFAFADRGQIWEYDLATDKARKVLELPDSGIRWLDYDPASHQYLFSRIDAKDTNPEKRHFLYRLDTNSSPPLTQVCEGNALNARWILNGGGISYVMDGVLVVDTKDPSLRTNLFVGGFAWNYSVLAGSDKLYAKAKRGSEPMGIWEYDIKKRQLRAVVPGMGEQMAHARISLRTDLFTKDGQIPYSVIPPTVLNPAKKYPVVLDQPSESQFSQDAQFLANSGIYYVTVKNDGVGKISAVYKEILKIPNVDPERIYIVGSSFRTETLSEAVNNNRRLWRGILLLGPSAFPWIPEDARDFPSVFVSVGLLDSPSTLRQVERFTRDACAHLVRTKVIYHVNAPHIFNSTKLARERYDAIIKFILAGS